MVIRVICYIYDYRSPRNAEISLSHTLDLKHSNCLNDLPHATITHSTVYTIHAHNPSPTPTPQTLQNVCKKTIYMYPFLPE